jgi:hypothetical protein
MKTAINTTSLLLFVEGMLRLSQSLLSLFCPSVARYNLHQDILPYEIANSLQKSTFREWYSVKWIR